MEANFTMIFCISLIFSGVGFSLNYVGPLSLIAAHKYVHHKKDMGENFFKRKFALTNKTKIIFTMYT